MADRAGQRGSAIQVDTLAAEPLSLTDDQQYRQQIMPRHEVDGAVPFSPGGFAGNIAARLASAQNPCFCHKMLLPIL